MNVEKHELAERTVGKGKFVLCRATFGPSRSFWPTYSASEPPALIGLIEGGSESTASLLKVFSGWFSDRLQQHKWLSVIGYGLAAASST